MTGDCAPEPGIRFFRAIPDARSPLPADKSAKGIMLTKAFRFCEPMRAASGWGYYVFPACDLTVVWNGHTDLACWWNGQRIGILDGSAIEAAQSPGFATLFDEHAPPDCQGYAWPLITALQEPGMIQVWTGWLVQTGPEWSLNVRPVVNRPRPPGYELFEGIIETDRWFGGLFANIYLTRTRKPIHIRRSVPLMQVQPVPRHVYQTAQTTTITGLEQWPADRWAAYYRTAVEPHPPGHYAVTSRQRAARSSATVAAAKGDSHDGP